MARRRQKKSATDANMDSMLDTLTNVVGILVIVLVAVQLSAQEAASRIADAVEKLDPQQLVRLEERLEESRQSVAQAQQQLEEERTQTQKTPEQQLERMKQQAAELEQRAREDAREAREREQKRTAAEQQVKAERERLERELATLEEEAKQAEEKRRALAVELEKMRPEEAPPVKEVRLPNPRTLGTRPDGKDPVRVLVLCQAGRVYSVVDQELRDPVHKRLDAIADQRRMRQSPKDAWLIDDPKTLEMLEKNLPNNSDFNYSLTLRNNVVYLVLEPKPNGGEPAAQAVKGGFARALKTADPRALYFAYRVFSDSFEDYLQLRQFTDAAGFGAGWDPVPPGFRHEIALKFRIGVKPPPAPAPSRPSTPPPRPQVLD